MIPVNKRMKKFLYFDINNQKNIAIGKKNSDNPAAIKFITGLISSLSARKVKI